MGGTLGPPSLTRPAAPGDTSTKKLKDLRGLTHQCLPAHVGSGLSEWHDVRRAEWKLPKEVGRLFPLAPALNTSDRPPFLAWVPGSTLNAD
jgi:hypothetical protein